MTLDAPRLRPTRQRQAVLEALDRALGFRSAQQLFEELRRQRVHIGLTTVYRTLRALADSHAIDSLMSPDGETLYRRCGRDSHHHHLVCRVCGLSVEIAAPAVERWAASTARRHGFSQVTHEVEIFGTCSTCQGDA